MMPFYTSITQDDLLSAEQRKTIAEEITRIHCAETGAPRSFVRVLFQTYPAGSGFSGSKEGPLASLRCVIRAGRTIEIQQKMMAEYWEMYSRVGGVAKDQTLIILEDIAAKQVMEFGAILPEPGGEDTWLAEHAPEAVNG